MFNMVIEYAIGYLLERFKILASNVNILIVFVRTVGR